MSPTIGADVSEDLKREVDEHREEGESRSAAVRRLVRDGLDVDDRPPGFHISYPVAISLLGWWLITATFFEAQTTATGWLGVALVAASLLYGIYARFLA